ncbi:hypothetical protein ACS3UN_04190 [Oscillospiraceae bacterium LTW-04]|nr:hypothetical protein RBH76_06275 [Oscillospiraceae bacterium MB24-C1]
MTFPLFYQDALFARLNALWQGGRFPHALLLAGPIGSGKRTAAQYAAAMLLCRKEGLPPCGVCPSCHKLSSGNHPDFFTLLPEGKSKTIGVDRVREIKAAAYISPHEAPRKVFFIPEAQRLRVEAQNALLKIIEEPPEAAYFIFTAPGPGSLLETVCSRLTICSMGELSEKQRFDALVHHLSESTPEALRTQAALFSTVGQALNSLNDPAARRYADDSAAIIAALSKNDRYTVLKLFSGYEKDREQFTLLLTALRSAVITRLTGSARIFSPLQSLQIIAIIDEMALRSVQNVSISLICAAAVNRLVKAAGLI